MSDLRQIDLRPLVRRIVLIEDFAIKPRSWQGRPFLSRRSDNRC